MRGTAGLTRLPFSAHNASERPIDCAIAAAHWYSVDLGTAAPDATVSATLWTVPSTGAVLVLNRSQDRLPIQSLWCGFAGEAWATRSTVALERRAGEPQNGIDLTCRAEAGRLSCR